MWVFSCLHISFLQAVSAVMLWSVFFFRNFLEPLSTSVLLSCRQVVVSVVLAILSARTRSLTGLLASVFIIIPTCNVLLVIDSSCIIVLGELSIERQTSLVASYLTAVSNSITLSDLGTKPEKEN